jgi:hypothetical protein
MIRFFNHVLFRATVTGIAMILAGLFQLKNPENSWTRYSMFIVYAIGIGWTLWVTKKDVNNPGNFKSLFQQGFRHFAITSLIMVGFMIGILLKNPEWASEEAAYQRTLLIETKKYTPAQIEEIVAQVEKQYAVRYISATVFGYLFMGAVFTAAGSLLIARKN